MSTDLHASSLNQQPETTMHDPGKIPSSVIHREQPKWVDDPTVFLPGGNHESDVRNAGKILQSVCYEGAKAGGWHNDLQTGLPRTAEDNDKLFATRIALCHSELSEALEGHRKGLMDDKLPERKMAEVELADTVIRCFDLAGAQGYDLGSAIMEKIRFNSVRADHKNEHRKGAGGKAY